MKKIKILFVFGTRPEAIKMVKLIKKVKNNSNFLCKVCVTGQHKQMLDQVLELYSIKPDFDLAIMEPNQDLTDVTMKTLEGLRSIFLDWTPNIVLVQGDTSTAFTTSLAAFYQKINVGHIEAGLRTGNIYSPWPEEMNRVLISKIASLHFAPTTLTKKNLLDEGVDKNNIYLTGNTVMDSLLEMHKKIQDPKIIKSMNKKFNFLDKSKKIILVTGHRRENFGGGFENICLGIKKISNIGNVQIVYPVHLNPNVQEPVNRILSQSNNIHLISPLDYLPFIYLMSKSSLILTDSGGIQEEASAFNIPLLVMRDNTERSESIDIKTVKLVGTDAEKIYGESLKFLNLEIKPNFDLSRNPFGDGMASEKIVKIILDFFNKKLKSK
tara:strand:+ start:325 stop:1467 length:1143 start_codon:yes stop_codon:yes gene_type:complete